MLVLHREAQLYGYMIFKEIYPIEKLKEFVQMYRLRHFIIPPNFKTYPKPFPPHPEQCITFYPRGAEITEIVATQKKIRRPRSIISGQYTFRVNRSSAYNEILIIVAVFKPGALFRLTGIPFYELLNQDVDLECVFPKEARLVNDLLSSSDDYQEMIEIIESFLLSVTQKVQIEPRVSDKIFNMMIGCSKQNSLDWFSREACLSQRQFERKSRQYIGISPKLLLRISRFNQTYMMRLRNPELDWLSISLACGYHDYQHLVKDYKDFVHTTPTIFFSEEANALDRALGLNR